MKNVKLLKYTDDVIVDIVLKAAYEIEGVYYYKFDKRLEKESLIKLITEVLENSELNHFQLE